MKLQFTPTQRMTICLFFMLTLFSFRSDAQVLLQDGFESAVVPDPPTGWVLEQINRPQWQSLEAVGYDGNEYEGDRCMYLDGAGSGTQADAWLFSPSFNFIAGKKYSISFYYKNQSSNQNRMQITLGDGQSSAVQTEIVWEKYFKNDIYAKGQINYTATTSGSRNMAFHAITKRLSTYIYIDKVEVKEVTAFEPLNLKTSNVTTSSVDASWDFVQDSVVYEYGVNDRMTPPRNTERTALNIATLSPLEPAKKYFLYVRSVGKKGRVSGWAIHQFASAYSIDGIETITCGQKFTNGSFIAGPGLYLDTYCEETWFSREFFHKFTPTVPGNYNLDVFSVNTGQSMAFLYKDAALGAGPEGWTCIGTSNYQGKFSFGPLVAGKEYLIMEKPKAAPGFPSSYSYGIECPAAPPAYDNCSNALTIATTPYSIDCAGTALTTVGATYGTLKDNLKNCGSFTGSDDDEIWIKFTATSNFTIFRFNKVKYDNFSNPKSKPGLYLNIFRNPCDLSSLADCGYIDVRPGTPKDVFSYKLKKGETYYCKIFTTDQFTFANFNMCIMDMTGTPGILNSCSNGLPYNINNYTDQGNTNWLVPFTDPYYLILGGINAKGNSLDEVNSALYVNQGPLRKDATGRVYLDRNISFEPATQPSSPVTVRLLIRNTELDRLINTPGSGVATIKDIRITQNDDVCAASFTEPSIAFIKPDQSGDFDANFKFVEFTTSKLSSFYLHGGNQALSNSSAASAVAAKASNIAWAVYPNPVTDKVTVTVNETGNTQYTISILDITGNRLKTIKVNASAGFNQFEIETSNLAKGVYMIKLEKSGNIVYQKIVKE